MSGLFALRLARGGQKSDVQELRALAFDNQTANFTNGLRVTGTGVKASQVVTFGSNVLNTLTITIGAKTYTFQDSLTNVDGNVDVGANAEGSIDNLVAAINLAAGAGTAYAAATTAHPTVSAVKASASTMRVTALVAGTAGNAIAVSETGSVMVWTGTELAGGINASGATGVLVEHSDAGTTGTLQLRNVVGDFTDNELITDTSTGSALVNGALSIPLLTPSDAIVLQADAVDMSRSDLSVLFQALEAKIRSMAWHADNGLFALRVNRGEQFHQVERLGALAYDGQSANFTAGDVITGGTSGAVGTLVEQTDGGATGTLILNEVVGVFENNDALTGDPAAGNGDATGAQSIPLLTPDDSLIMQIDGVDFTKAEAQEALRQIKLYALDMNWPAAEAA
jgi:hypothetical protein